ncbi:MAG TPA: plastocyanin/azurin family copper-binding protein [Candidatus Nitrosotalea sp.]|nr:plastocyanin/azurin family copper-binding protein [Candidatus Nitrosotalea sp.]
MKSIHLGIIIILGSSLGIAHQVFADGTNGVVIQDITVKPPVIKVGDNFNITTTLVNNSPSEILVHNDCISPFSVTFDSHATIEVKKPCIYFAISKPVKPGENITVSGPGANISYKATDTGVANATITFSHTSENKSDSDISSTANPNSISKSVLFGILPQDVQTTNTVPSPLEQFKSGVNISNMVCKEGLYLAIKSKNQEPTCLKAGTISKLASRGFLYHTNANNANYTTIIIPPGSENQASHNSYSPDSATVVLGVNNTVQWVNQAETANTIVPDMPLTQNGKSFGSDGVIKPGQSYQFTFTEPGVFSYHTEPHPWMKGSITVLSQTKIITLVDNNQQIDLQKGQRMVLNLGKIYDWNVNIGNDTVISRVPNIMVMQGVQGIFEAHNVGETTLEATGDPPCLKATPRCAMPSILFQINIIVS